MVLTNGWWSKVPVGVSFDVFDANPATTLFSVAGSVEQTYTGPFTIATEGTTTVLFRSVDQSEARNAETTQTGYVRIDRAAPEVTGDENALYAAEPRYVVSAADAGSGVLAFTARLDGGVLHRGALSAGWRIALPNPNPGVHTVEYTALDMLSNEVTGTLTFTVKAKQTLSATSAGKTLSLLRSRSKASTMFSVAVRKSDGSALAGKTVWLEKSTDGATWTRYGSEKTTGATGKASAKVTFTKAGTTYWRWRSPETDRYREAASKKTKVVVR